MELQLAKIEDAEAVSRLLNLAYRGDKGWTTEENLVSGQRSNESDIKAELSADNSYFLVHKVDAIVHACICIHHTSDSAYIGSFAVLPEHQDLGLGSLILNEVEQFIKHQLKAKTINMVVLSDRFELIAYYERRGYQQTGSIESYPESVNIGQPINPNQTVKELVKYV